MSEVVTKKLALFRTPGEYGSDFAYTDWAETSKGHARVSEYVEVQFPALAIQDVVSNQLDSLAAAEAELRTRFQVEIDKIATERGKLLALTHTV